ncbi:MAG: fibrinogen-like YCDxxxxGGGW domain-containing protein, partial [Myxococcota bacterium]|nr:fibrinogen-like YCDxxxxGGGW domain-containing protein [Myxococcota bacterium]
MTNIEGRQTDREQNQDFIYLDVHERFSDGPADYELGVSYVDSGTAQWYVEYGQEGCLGATETVENGDSGEVRTVWFALDQAVFDDPLPGATDLRIHNGGLEDIEVRMVRLVRRSMLGCGDGERSDAEACDDGNTDAGDGCDPTCMIEENWSCDGPEPDSCSCAEGWAGADCAEPVCPGGCNGDGTCIAPDTCDCDPGYRGRDCGTSGDPTSCEDILAAGEAWFGSGMYTIKPAGTDSPIEVYCDMETHGGGWTIVWASTDGCTAGRPWDPVPGSPDDYEACGDFVEDPREGRVRLDWDVLQAIDQDEHILIRPAYPESWLQNPWLAVNHAFFRATGSVEDLPLEVTVTSATTIGSGIDAHLGFTTDDDAVERGGWYGLSVLDGEAGWDGLSGRRSSSRRWTNSNCTGHLVTVYRDAHMFSTALFMEDADTLERTYFDWDFLGWPATTEGCASSAEATVTTWIGVRED